MRLFLVIALALIVSATTPAHAEKRVALVIGNSAYQNAAPLPNPVNDAQDMAIKLSQLGFEVVEGYDLDKIGMDIALRNFSKASRTSDMNVFFYAGHGMSVNGSNYLVPVDAALMDETSLDFETVPVDFITRQMSYSDAVNLVFLDACRDNPLSKQLARSMSGATRSAAISTGLAEMKIENPGKGLAIAFATSPGDVALDGEGANSPFTSALLKHIDAPNKDITEVFSLVTGEVYASTAQQQRPWLNSSLTGSVVLNPTLTSAPATASAGDAGASALASGDKMANIEEQKLLFELARESGDVLDYQAYLDTFPNGLYANNARRTIQKLKAEGSQTASLGTTPSQPAGDNSRARSIDEFGALRLPVTRSLQAAPADPSTEAQLGLTHAKRGEIQARLNASGNSIGGVDGQWGPNTRRGIAGWQTQNGLPPTGYLNGLQLDLLVSQTEGRFTPWTPQATPQRSTTQQSAARTQPRTTTRQGPSAGEVGQVLQGIGSIIQGLNR